MKSKHRLPEKSNCAGEKTDGGQFSIILQGAALTGLKWPRLMLLLGFVVGIVGISAALVRPLTQDEADPFAISAAAIAERGPAALGERQEGSWFPGGTRYEIPHPPLYNLLLAAIFRIVGVGAMNARALGFLCHVATLLLMVLMACRISKDSNDIGSGDLASGALGLYMLLPIAIQYPLFIDIDNSLLTPLLLGFLLLVMRQDATGSHLELFLTGVLLALCLWCKETTPYIALAAAAIWWLLRSGLRCAVFRTVAVFLVGSILFVVTWWLFCAATDVPPLAFWEFTIGKKLLGGGGPTLGLRLSRLWGETNWIANWYIPAFLLLTAVAVLDRLIRIVMVRKASCMDLLVLWIILLYTVHGLYYPGLKYVFPLLSAATLLVIGLAIRTINHLSGRELTLLLSLVTAMTLLFLFLGRDPILYGSGWSIRHRFFWMTGVPIAAAFLTLIPLAGLRRGLVMGLLSVVLAVALQQDVRHIGMESTVPSWGDYGERGSRGLIEKLDQSLSEHARIIARIDHIFGVSEAAGRPGRQRVAVGLYRNERQLVVEELESILLDPSLSAIVFDNQRRPWTQFKREEALVLARKAGFIRENRFGDFLLLTRPDVKATTAQ